MVFSKEFLKDRVDEGVYQKVIDTTRWSILYEEVFEHEGKFYLMEYSVGATEQQDETPFQYDDDDIWCDEVELTEKVVKVWTKVKK